VRMVRSRCGRTARVVLACGAHKTNLGTLSGLRYHRGRRSRYFSFARAEIFCPT